MKISDFNNRYFRPVIAHPEGAIVHHGDCMIWSLTPVCTCGLLHDLMPMNLPETLYENYGVDLQKQNIFLNSV